MELLIDAMKAWLMAVYGGLELRKADNFDWRKEKFLPESAKRADSALKNEKLKDVAPETARTVRVESNNAAGIAFMYMGKYASLLGKETESCWKTSEEYYQAARRLHPQDVRVLDNLATLLLMRASLAWRDNQLKEIENHGRAAEKLILEALAYNTHDQFRHRLHARACALLLDKEGALAAVKQMRYEPGVFKPEDIDALEAAINASTLAALFELPEEKKLPEQLRHRNPKLDRSVL